ncbi:MAG: methyltransferase family protein [Candidatus Paceibacterota bacterium]
MLYSLIIFQILHALMVIVILLAVFDVRFRGKWQIDQRSPLLIGIFLPLYTVGHISVLLFSFSDSINILDWVAFSLTFLALLIIVKARIDLKHSYAWPGQMGEKVELVKTGVYAYTRHPLYTGIYLYILGSLISVIYYSDLILGILMTLVAAALIVFLSITAQQEEERLQKDLGGIYVSYKAEVQSTLPLDVLKIRRTSCEENDNGEG